jgi:hypothetical protein
VREVATIFSRVADQAPSPPRWPAACECCSRGWCRAFVNAGATRLRGLLVPRHCHLDPQLGAVNKSSAGL